MGRMTFLRALVIVAYAMPGFDVPWHVWLWAIVSEIDNVIESVQQYRYNTLMIKETEAMIEEVSNSGNNPPTSV